MFAKEFFARALIIGSLAVVASAQTRGVVHGVVIDGRTGQSIPAVTAVLQPIQNPGIQDLETSTLQPFLFSGILPGDYVLEVSAPGFVAARTQFHLSAGEQREFEVTLTPRLAPKNEVVSVEATAGFEPSNTPGGNSISLSGKELLNLSTVLADDPLRAVQGLPGVAADNDFEAKFSLRGADFSRVGIYLDGILLPNPLHSFESAGLAGSASILNRALIDELDLYQGPFPETFGDRSAGIVEIKLRDGDPKRYHFQTGANFAQANAGAEGPLGAFDRCSWIGAYRKTYLQYLLAGKLPDPSMLFGMQDAQGRISCRANPKNMLSLDLIDSYTGIDQSGAQSALTPTALMVAHQHAELLNFGWLYTPADKLLINAHLAYVNNTVGEENAASVSLGNGRYQEKIWTSNLQWMPDSHLGLNAGVSARAIQGSGVTQTLYSITNYKLLNSYSGSATVAGGYLQQVWTAWAGRLHLEAGQRWSHDSADHKTGFSPEGSLALGLLPVLEWQLGWGQFVQFPDLSVINSDLGSPALLPIVSRQLTTGLALHLGKSSLIRALVYDRDDRNVPYQPYADPRLLLGKVFFPPYLPRYENSLNGHGRGGEVYLQRRMGKRLSGLISYSYSHTLMHDRVTGVSFPSDFDQRHTINAYAIYAWRPNIDLSMRYTYGSGFPIPGFITEIGNQYYLSSARNTARLPPYQSLDFRLNKTWPHQSWKLKLYSEIVNATNHSNESWAGLIGFSNNPTDGLDAGCLSQFPILPSIGIAFEF
jgi:hypothetical protein